MVNETNSSDYFNLAREKVDLLFVKNLDNDKRINLSNEIISLCEQTLSSSTNNEIEVGCHSLQGIAYFHLALVSELNLIKEKGLDSLPSANNSILEKELAIKLDLAYKIKLLSSPEKHFDFFPTLDMMYMRQARVLNDYKT